MSRTRTFSFDQLMSLAVSSWADSLGKTPADLMPASTLMRTLPSGEPVFVLTRNTDRDRVEPEAFEPGGA